MWSFSVKRLQQRPPKLQGISARHRPETTYPRASTLLMIVSDAAIYFYWAWSKQAATKPPRCYSIPRSDAVRPASVHCLLSFSLWSFISSFLFSSPFTHNCHFVSLYIPFHTSPVSISASVCYFKSICPHLAPANVYFRSRSEEASPPGHCCLATPRSGM